MAAGAVLALLGFQVFFSTEASMVQCNAGGYEDIVIAIHPGVPEDVAIIEKIQAMVKEATYYLFNATGQRLYINSTKILIPTTWSLNYTNRTRERYEKADVVIANTFLTIGDSPYTRQHGGCGEQGQYIHFTPSFLLQENFTSLYGPFGKVFVHEWAHLRWGVFEEHNPDQPFYISGKGQVEATRCSVSINGTYRVLQPKEQSCVTRPCRIHRDTGVFTQDCTFFPEKDVFAAESIMYAPALQSVSGFCDETTHNMEAPTMQNRMCDCHSTWDIIKKSSDIVSTEPKENFSIPTPTFSLIRYRERVITLAIDVSESMMSHNRLWRAHQAADIFLTESLATGTYVGLVEFHEFSYILSELQQITNDNVRESLKSRLPTTVTTFGSDFCLGIRTAFNVNKKSGSLHGTEIIFLEDGDNSKGSLKCLPEIRDSGAIIHVIALSNEASNDLEQIADATGGLKYFVTDDLESTDMIAAFIGISNENGGGYGRVSQLEGATINVNPGQCVSDPVYVDSTAGADIFFTVTWQSSEPSITLEDPDTEVYTTANFTTTEASHLSRMNVPGIAKRGVWKYTLCNNFTQAQVLGITVTSKSSDVTVPPVTVNVHMNNDTKKYPNPMVVYASVSQGQLQVKGAKVTAIITPEKGAPIVLDLLDNGAGADIVKDDGIYSKYFFRFSVSGRYGLKARVTCDESECRLTHLKNRVFALPGFVENGKVVMNPSKPPQADVLPALDSLRRIAAGGSFTVSGVVSTETDVYPPGKITDLEAKRIDESIVLSWTAPGDDLDDGSAQSYNLRVSSNMTELRDDFEGSAMVDITGLRPSAAGSPETFTFHPTPDIEDVTIFYFALIAVDKNLQKSAPSNIAQAAIWVPTTADTTQCPIQKTTTCATKYVQVCDSAPTQPRKCPSKPKPKCPAPKVN
ncbi:calcium-activated chloride channel regulator 1-like [Leptodactylus fuscus]|uniref:calcium-activated chloride channel regulator 1-like n=1 Tax=Leptodactylus fuscus TaxID=238119 RepID=UPI003F4E60A9